MENDIGEKITLSVVIPAYLEEENLRLLLPRLRDVLISLGVRHEVLVVDTHEPMDNTREVCDRNMVRYLNRTGDNFFGDAIRTGIREASGEFTLFMDGDGSHPPEFIRNLYAALGDNDIVIASRYIEGGSTDNIRVLILMSLVVNLLYSIVLNLRCKDVSNNFKLYRTYLLKDLKLSCSNFDIVEEILFKIKRARDNVKIREIPFSFKKRMFGHTKRNLFAFGFSFITTLIRLRFSK